MTNTILNHWRMLAGNVHPSDQDVLAQYSHGLNLDFPPPAFLGDIENAPIVLLLANGGYDPDVTPSEFSTPRAVQKYLEYIHDPKPIDPATIAPYYGTRNYADLIRSGHLALVNALPYRSSKVTPAVRKLANQLPSTMVHRKWLANELLKQAAAGDRLVIAHRNSMWGIIRNQTPPKGLIFTENPRSPNLSWKMLQRLSNWLDQQ